MAHDWIPKRLQKQKAEEDGNDTLEWDVWYNDVQHMVTGLDTDQFIEIVRRMESEDMRAGPLAGLRSMKEDVKDLMEMLRTFDREINTAISAVEKGVRGG